MKGQVFFRESKAQANPARARKAGTWTYQFDVPKAGGGRRYLTRGGFATKRAAEAALVEALAEHGRTPNATVEPSKMTLERFLVDEWLPTTRSLKQSTAAGYRQQVDSYITPRLGHVRLCDLTPGQIVKFYGFLIERGGKSRRKGAEPFTQPLSERSVHKTHVVLGSALQHAVEMGLVRANPVLQIPKKNRPKQSGGSDKPEMKVWSADQAAAFIAATAGDRWASIYDLDLNTGLRRGELAGLRWVDVDLDAAVLSVRRNRVVVDGQVLDVTPKSKKPRVVDLDVETVAMLRRWRRRQLEERMAWGEAWTDSGYVFTIEDGKALHPETIGWHLERLTRTVNRAITKAQGDKPGPAPTIPAIRLHDLRHTHATLGLAAGIPVKVMSERLGHASTQITMDLYSHVIPGMQADAAAKIGGLLRGSATG
jgi:integrase